MVKEKQLPRYLQALYPFEPNYLDVKGGRMHYVDEGSGVPVIMLHGNPTWSFYYRNLILGLDGFRCIAPDHIGCGLSDKPKDFSYRLKDHIDNLFCLVEHLGLEKFHLVVHDWGGPMGIALAEYFPKRVEKIAILNTAAFRSSLIPWQLQFCRIPLLAKVFIQGLNGFALPATHMAVKKPMKREVKDGYLFPYRGWSDRRATYQFVQDIPLNESHESYSTLATLENNLYMLSEADIAFFWGGQDFVFTKDFLDAWIQRFPKAAVNYFEEAGHYLLEDAHEEVIPKIRGFLSACRESSVKVSEVS
ncbi:MAG TPA: alpha/beta hydrolase [Opitutae bacterium]|nr:alpha/beta hydrolase [Opitutae bacterium]|tara:strand:- start:414 stop:1325 length:912 start_codon:yes stop_codon:yes gene_type:complete